MTDDESPISLDDEEPIDLGPIEPKVIEVLPESEEEPVPFDDDDGPIWLGPIEKKTLADIMEPEDDPWPTEDVSDEELLLKARRVVNASLEGFKVTASQHRAALAVINNAARVRGQTNSTEELRSEFDSLIEDMVK